MQLDKGVVTVRERVYVKYLPVLVIWVLVWWLQKWSLDPGLEGGKLFDMIILGGAFLVFRVYWDEDKEGMRKGLLWLSGFLLLMIGLELGSIINSLTVGMEVMKGWVDGVFYLSMMWLIIMKTYSITRDEKRVWKLLILSGMVGAKHVIQARVPAVGVWGELVISMYYWFIY